MSRPSLVRMLSALGRALFSREFSVSQAAREEVCRWLQGASSRAAYRLFRALPQRWLLRGVLREAGFRLDDRWVQRIHHHFGDGAEMERVAASPLLPPEQGPRLARLLLGERPHRFCERRLGAYRLHAFRALASRPGYLPAGFQGELIARLPPLRFQTDHAEGEMLLEALLALPEMTRGQWRPVLQTVSRQPWLQYTLQQRKSQKPTWFYLLALAETPEPAAVFAILDDVFESPKQAAFSEHPGLLSHLPALLFSASRPPERRQAFVHLWRALPTLALRHLEEDPALIRILEPRDLVPLLQGGLPEGRLRLLRLLARYHPPAHAQGGG